jgi:hypothetical protein
LTAKQKVTQIINCVCNNKKYIIYDNTTFYDKGDIEVYWKVGSIIHYYGLLLRLPRLPQFLGWFVHPLFDTSACCSAIDCIHDLLQMIDLSIPLYVWLLRINCPEFTFTALKCPAAGHCATRTQTCFVAVTWHYSSWQGASPSNLTSAPHYYLTLCS